MANNDEQATFFAVNGLVAVSANKAICDAVAARVTGLILTTLKPKADNEPNGDSHPTGYCYDGYRTEPSEIGWRFIQNYGEPTPESIAAGEWDEAIVWTFHEAAASEYWYRYEKDWGSFDF
jgi:hypothetical protein